MKAAKGGGTPVALASGLGRASDVAVDATHVYWTDTDAGTIMKIAKQLVIWRKKTCRPCRSGPPSFVA